MKKVSIIELSKSTGISQGTIRMWSKKYNVGDVVKEDHFNEGYIKEKLAMIEDQSTLLSSLGITSLNELEIVRNVPKQAKVAVEVEEDKIYTLGYGKNAKVVKVTAVLNTQWDTYYEYVDASGKHNISTKEAFTRRIREGECNE